MNKISRDQAFEAMSKLSKIVKDYDNDHRLTLRIPKYIMDMIDTKRRERVGKISRNLMILEIIEESLK